MIAGLKFLGSSFACSPLLITLLQLSFQLTERCKFPALEFPDPAFADLMDRDGIEVVQLLAAMPERGDEVGRFENPKVFCDRLPRHGEAVAEFVQRLSASHVKPV